ncbi:hypothetical protein [Nocardia sp. NPDC057227]|uniref:hypothetical protein n=1 Tax=Nocardia sp. NPDC057227 TaxID=3346056 RepID=UPI00363F9B2D
MSGKAWGWALFALGVVTVGAGTGLFVWLGLSKGDQLASILSLFVGIAGLAASIAGLVLARKPSAVQAITGSSISGNAEVVRNVGGNYTLRRAPSTAAAPVPGTTSTTAPVAAEQTITGSGIGGSARIVDGVTGNVDINE